MDACKDPQVPIPEWRAVGAHAQGCERGHGTLPPCDASTDRAGRIPHSGNRVPGFRAHDLRPEPTVTPPSRPQLQAHDWRCGACGAPRDPGEAESALCDALGTLCDSQVLQDLQCVKCHNVATEHLRGQCDHCGGQLAACKPAGETLARVRVFQKVARFHGMPVLEELAGWVLTQHGGA